MAITHFEITKLPDAQYIVSRIGTEALQENLLYPIERQGELNFSRVSSLDGLHVSQSFDYRVYDQVSDTYSNVASGTLRWETNPDTDPVLSLSPTFTQANPLGSVYTVSVESNRTWNISSVEPSGIAGLEANKVDSTTFTVTIPMNSTGTERDIIVKVSNGVVKQTVFNQQPRNDDGGGGTTDPAPTLSLSPSYIPDAGWMPEEYTINVDSNRNWTASGSSVGISQQTGSSFTITTHHNHGGPRTLTVTVTTTGSPSTSRNVSIDQEGNGTGDSPK